ncbi:MAG: hypothetical protein K8R23_04995 [Chthoniobacter sp.]|nr:hypothetical protein [Chthoniobacter sp.]
MKVDEFTKIGTDLIADSKAMERTPGEILEELYPYVLEASRRMSAREISRWLQEKRGIQISQPTISRVLRSGTGWHSYSEIIHPVALRVASSLGLSLESFLLDDSKEGANDFEHACENAKRALSEEEYKEVEEGLVYLREKWFSLSLGTRRACAPKFVDMEDRDEP